ESKYELGSAAKSDVLKQKVQYGNDRLSLLSAENSVDETKSSLAYTIGLDPNSDPKFSSSFTEVDYDGNLNDAMQYGLDNHPGLLSARKLVDASGYAVKSRKAGYLPRVSLTGSMNWNESTEGDTITYDFSSKSKSIGFNVSWNIFDGFSRERNIAIAKIGQNNAKANLADTRNLVAKEIKTAFLEIERLKEQKMVSQENVDASEEDLRIQQEKYDLGAAAILDLLNAQVSLKQAQVSLIGAEFDFNLAVSRLNKAMGKRKIIQGKVKINE
ncbi:MAG: TolC family protein, partial [candidate division Zixibacteria bacterium]|nr:TolC family protein [candidate division Zixibacteria bacterium]